jgi:hypothetical protein
MRPTSEDSADYGSAGQMRLLRTGGGMREPRFDTLRAQR